jgi:hypothetical protein
MGFDCYSKQVLANPLRLPGRMRSPGFASCRSFLSLVARIYVPSAVCFLVACVTNSTLLSFLVRHGFVYGGDGTSAMSLEKTVRFFLVPVKGFLFFAGTGLLFFPLANACRAIFGRIRRNPHSYKAPVSLCVCLCLISTLVPLSFGRSYARISTDPFSQEADQLYRRLLLPGLAYLWHVNGVLYVIFFWVFLLFAALTVRTYFLDHGIDLSVLQEVSFLTAGIFAASFDFPGNPEIVVFLFAMLALITFEADGYFSEKQLAAFSLALIAHESAAVIIFLPMICVLFRPRSWIPSAGMLMLYGGAVLANFSFHPAEPLRIQTEVSGHPASYYFQHSLLLEALAVLLSFKVFWVLIVVALFYLLRSRSRTGYFVLFALALAMASTSIATDYSRLISFATVPLILCFIEAHRRLSSRIFRWIVITNLLTPSFAAYGVGKIIAFRGLYYLVFRHVIRLPAPPH